MATTFALQALNLKAGSAPEHVETLFEAEIFAASTEVKSGDVARGGASIIGSQHLLRLAGGSTE